MSSMPLLGLDTTADACSQDAMAKLARMFSGSDPRRKGGEGSREEGEGRKEDGEGSGKEGEGSREDGEGQSEAPSEAGRRGCESGDT